MQIFISQQYETMADLLDLLQDQFHAMANGHDFSDSILISTYGAPLNQTWPQVYMRAVDHAKALKSPCLFLVMYILFLPHSFTFSLKNVRID